MERLKRLSNDSYDTIKRLSKKKKELKKQISHEINNFFSLEDKIKKIERAQPQSFLLICEHTFSKAFEQPFPRLCTKCNQPEKELKNE